MIQGVVMLPYYSWKSGTSNAPSAPMAGDCLRAACHSLIDELPNEALDEVQEELEEALLFYTGVAQSD